MIEILTLFLGLYHGVQPIELKVADDVAAVELLLDGESVGKISQPPWAISVDFGEALQPHELIAIARDTEGDEIGRARRWVNREIEPPDAWVGSAPDGSAHGGIRRDEATAVVVRLDPGGRLPPLAQMQQWFSVDGQTLEVLKVEEGPAEVVVVMDPMARPYLDRTASFFFEFRLGARLAWDPATLVDKQAFVTASRQDLMDRGQIKNAQYAGRVWEQWRHAFSFGQDASVRFISPRAAPISRVARSMKIFNFTIDLESNEAGLLWHSAVARPLQFRPRLSDAVAIAGLEAHASRQRRAVLLIMVDQAMGASRYSPAAVRDYLEDLQVPLYVWDFGLKDGRGRSVRASASDGREWGQAHDLSRLQVLDSEELIAWNERVKEAAEGVRQALRRQRVVWLAGAHLPDRIELSDPAEGITWAGPWDLAIEEGVH